MAERRNGEEMKNFQHFKSRTKNSSAWCVLIIVTSLVSILSFLVIFWTPVSAQSVDTETQTTTLKTFLPITMVGKPVYYVSPDGNDYNSGTLSSPWKTMTKAAKMVSPGDTVYVRAGVYMEAVRIEASGTEQKPINFLAYPGENPILDGNNRLPHSWTGLITAAGDWIRISGFEIRNSAYVGLQLEGRHDRADHIFSHHNQLDGMFIQGDYGIIENSRLWKNAMINENDALGNREPALATARDSVDGTTDYAIIRNNVVWENWGIGIDTFESNGTIIESNIIHDNIGNVKISDATNIVCNRNFLYMVPGSPTYGLGANYGILLGDEKYNPPSANITITNNIAYGNLKNLSWYVGVQGGGMNNVLIANNTFANNMPNGGNHRNIDINSGTHNNVRIYNNIIIQDDSQPIEDIAIDPEVMISNNLWSKPPRTAILGDGDIIGNPYLQLTKDPYSVDWYKLTGYSPAIGHALSLTEVPLDYFGNIREAPPDIGADEFFPTP